MAARARPADPRDRTAARRRLGAPAAVGQPVPRTLSGPGTTWAARTCGRSSYGLSGWLPRSPLWTVVLLEPRHPLIETSHGVSKLVEAPRDHRCVAARELPAVHLRLSGSQSGPHEHALALLADYQALTAQLVERVADDGVRNAVQLPKLGHRRELRADRQRSPSDLLPEVRRHLEVRRRSRQVCHPLHAPVVSPARQKRRVP